MKKSVIFLLALLLLPFAFAEIEQYNIDFTISVGKVYVVQEAVYETEQEFEFDFPADVREPEIIIDGEERENGTGKTFTSKYVTERFIDNKNFVMELEYPEDIEYLRITLTLPSNLELLEPVQQETLSSDAIFPNPTDITTDGQRITLIWEKNNLEAGDSIPVLVRLKEKKDYSYLAYLLIIAGIVIAVLAYFIIRRKPKVQTVVKTRTRKLEEHLKEDEAQIVRILKSRGGECEQGTLRVVTGFSKAKLSGLLMELEARKIIHKEKRGKKNLVFLK